MFITIRNRIVHDFGGRFEFIFVDFPESTDVVFVHLDRIFGENLPDRFVNTFDLLATDHWIEEITDPMFDRL